MRYLPAAWRLELLGWLRAHNDEGSQITRFQTHQTGALLAYLALNPQRSHTRDEIGDILWPDADVESMRHRFRQALSSLRKQMELPGTPHGSIIAADRWSVRLNVDAVSTDVAAFEQTLKDAAKTAEFDAKLTLLLRAFDLYRGELLPGFYEDCFLSERARLADRYEDLLRQLVHTYRELGEPKLGLEYAKKRVELDPLSEEAQIALIQLYEQLGERSAALRQYQQLEQVLDQEIGETPSAETVKLIEDIRKSPRPAPILVAKSGGKVFHKKKQAEVPAKPAAKPKIPLQFTRFFGRGEELVAIDELLKDPSNRLITVVGMGGVGKTRLALQAAQSCAAIFGEHIFLALLAPIDDPLQVLDAVAKSLGIQRIPGLPLSQQIVKHLNDLPRCLLVLDNFEHILSGASDVRDLIQEIPRLQCLVTSRHRLRIDGERLFQLKPLPPPSKALPAADLLKTPCTQMLIDRAQTVMPDFQITERNSETIASICERLEGIPLAIELAAAWARILSPGQMLDQLSTRFNILISKRPDINERHRTLRATIDYTYSLMSPELQRFFVSLSVFRGGWTLRAAINICRPSDGINMLDELLDWSLVVSEGAQYESSDMRCSMLETIQEYAWELISDEEKSVLAARRYDYFLSLVTEAEQDLAGPRVKEAYQRVDAEYANIAACLRWCDENHLALEGCVLATRLYSYWGLNSNSTEARSWLERFIAMDEPVLSSHLTEARAAVTGVLSTQGDYEPCARFARECAKEFESLGSEVGVARMLAQLGFCQREQGLLEEAKVTLSKALEIAGRSGDLPVTALIHSNLGMLAGKEGKVLDVVENFERSLGIYRTLDDRLHLSISLNNYGFSLLLMGDFENAEPYIAESLDIINDLGLAVSLTARINLSYIKLLKQDLEAAKALLRGTLLESSRYGLRRQLYCCVGQFAMIARRERRFEQSAVLFFAMIGLSQALGLDSDDPYMRFADEAIVELSQVLSPVAYALANARGRSLPTKDLVEYSLVTSSQADEEIA